MIMGKFSVLSHDNHKINYLVCLSLRNSGKKTEEGRWKVEGRVKSISD